MTIPRHFKHKLLGWGGGIRKEPHGVSTSYGVRWSNLRLHRRRAQLYRQPLGWYGADSDADRRIHAVSTAK
jgi:hypothetical protein